MRNALIILLPLLILDVPVVTSAADKPCRAGLSQNAKKKSCVANSVAEAKAPPPPICETGEECVALMQKVMREGVGFATERTKVEEVFFTGSSIYIIASFNDGKPLIYLDVTNDMPWAEFQKFKTSGPCEDTAPWCEFAFDFGRQVNMQSKVLSQNEVFFPKSNPGYFYLRLPRSQIPEGANTLSAAAKRLSDLAKDGKFTPKPDTEFPEQLATVKAIGVRQLKKIEGKPTYEQTVQFITNYFDDDFFRSGDYFECGNAIKDTKLYRSDIVAIKDVNFVGCELTTEFTQTEWWIGLDSSDKQTSTYSHRINFGEVTEIAIERRGGKIYCFGFVFLPAKKIEWVLPFTRTSDGDFDARKDNKLYKAFEHLRKMCGAPEPLDF